MRNGYMVNWHYGQRVWYNNTSYLEHIDAKTAKGALIRASQIIEEEYGDPTRGQIAVSSITPCERRTVWVYVLRWWISRDSANQDKLKDSIHRQTKKVEILTWKNRYGNIEARILCSDHDTRCIPNGKHIRSGAEFVNGIWGEDIVCYSGLLGNITLWAYVETSQSDPDAFAYELFSNYVKNRLFEIRNQTKELEKVM